MRADKEFFNRLRQEVQEDVSNSFVIIDRPINEKGENDGDSYQQNDDSAIKRMEEKIKALESQLSILKSRNNELIEKNKLLEATIKKYETTAISFEVEKGSKTISEMNTSSTNLTVSAIAEYARNWCSLDDAKAIKMMLREMVLNPCEEDNQAIQEILIDFIEPQKKAPLISIKTDSFHANQVNEIHGNEQVILGKNGN